MSNTQNQHAQAGQVERRVMHIYRVQDKQGRGPFRPGITDKWIEMRPDHENLVPFFEEWKGFDPCCEAKQNEHLGVGCMTLEQLRRWFTETEYNRLRILGYRAVKVRADRILRSSDKQCVFVRNRALRDGATEIALYA